MHRLLRGTAPHSSVRALRERRQAGATRHRHPILCKVEVPKGAPGSGSLSMTQTFARCSRQPPGAGGREELVSHDLAGLLEEQVPAVTGSALGQQGVQLRVWVPASSKRRKAGCPWRVGSLVLHHRRPGCEVYGRGSRAKSKVAVGAHPGPASTLALLPGRIWRSLRRRSPGCSCSRFCSGP